MINRIIEFSMKNRWLILAVYAVLAAWGYWALLHTPIDAIPDLSENQVIVFTDWPGRSPQEVEDQITYRSLSICRGCRMCGRCDPLRPLDSRWSMSSSRTRSIFTLREPVCWSG